MTGRGLSVIKPGPREVSDHEFTTLLDGEWRPHPTAAWLIGLDRGEQFRSRIGELLVASQDTDADQCPTSASGRTRQEPGSTQGDRGEGASQG